MPAQCTPTQFYFAHVNAVFRRRTTALYFSPRFADVSRLLLIQLSFAPANVTNSHRCTYYDSTFTAAV